MENEKWVKITEQIPGVAEQKKRIIYIEDILQHRQDRFFLWDGTYYRTDGILVYEKPTEEEIKEAELKRLFNKERG